MGTVSHKGVEEAKETKEIKETEQSRETDRILAAELSAELSAKYAAGKDWVDQYSILCQLEDALAAGTVSLLQALEDPVLSRVLREQNEIYRLSGPRWRRCMQRNLHLLETKVASQVLLDVISLADGTRNKDLLVPAAMTFLERYERAEISASADGKVKPWQGLLAFATALGSPGDLFPLVVPFFLRAIALPCRTGSAMYWCKQEMFPLLAWGLTRYLDDLSGARLEEFLWSPTLEDVLRLSLRFESPDGDLNTELLFALKWGARKCELIDKGFLRLVNRKVVPRMEWPRCRNVTSPACGISNSLSGAIGAAGFQGTL